MPASLLPVIRCSMTSSPFYRTPDGSRGAVLRRREATWFSSPSDDEVGGYKARSARSERSGRSNTTAQKGAPVNGQNTRTT